MQERQSQQVFININYISDAIKGIRGEFVRKILHFMVAIVPILANIDKTLTIFLLATAIIFYTIMEKLRQEGVYVLLISDLTAFASRERDKGHFVMGPVTLALGAMLAVSLYPEPASRLAIYALAFGDGLASLMGRFFRGPKLPFTGGKTLIGSLSCLVAVFIVSWRVLGNPWQALLLAVVATVLEVFPTQDFDNILMPVGTGFCAMLLLSLS